MAEREVGGALCYNQEERNKEEVGSLRAAAV